MNEQPPPPAQQPTMPRTPRRRPAASRVFAGAIIGCIATFATLGWLAIGATAQADSTPLVTDEEFEELFDRDSTINFDHEDGECDLSSVVGEGFDIDDIDWGAINFQVSTTDSSLDASLDTGNDQFTLACRDE